jgi:hypothetical protein
MDDARRFRVYAAECMSAAKTCQPGYRSMLVFYRHLLAFACLPGRADRRAACKLDADANLWNHMNSQ